MDDALVLCDDRSNLSYLVIYSQKHEQRNANLIERSIFGAGTYSWFHKMNNCHIRVISEKSDNVVFTSLSEKQQRVACFALTMFAK